MMAENLQQAFSSLEDANRKLEQDVEQKKRLLAERKELVDNLSHEMKTPLGVIRAYAEGLQDETDEAKRQKYSEVIITETERMSRLITTLLDLSALENGATQLRPERFDFVDFLETVAGRLLIDTPDADFVLEYELPEHPVYVNTDKGRMEQVLNNLIVNAKRNNRPGGILRLSLLEKDGLLNFSIFNQGAPIPEACQRYGRNSIVIKIPNTAVPGWALPLLHRSCPCSTYTMAQKISREAWPFISPSPQ